MHTYIYTYVHTCMHACIHTYIHTYTYIHTCIHRAIAPNPTSQAMHGRTGFQSSLSWLNTQFLDELFHWTSYHSIHLVSRVQTYAYGHLSSPIDYTQCKTSSHQWPCMQVNKISRIQQQLIMYNQIHYLYRSQYVCTYTNNLSILN